MIRQYLFVSDQKYAQVITFDSKKCAANQFLWPKVATHGIQGDLHGQPLNFGINDVYG
jgi:hypothetical protein